MIVDLERVRTHNARLANHCSVFSKAILMEGKVELAVFMAAFIAAELAVDRTVGGMS
jgi:hypothetical protein